MPRLRFLRPSTGLGLEKRGIHPRIWSFIGRFHYLRLFAWLLLALISASLNIKLCDLQLGRLPKVTLFGKGRKTRIVPLMEKTVLHLKKYSLVFHSDVFQRQIYLCSIL